MCVNDTGEVRLKQTLVDLKGKKENRKGATKWSHVALG